MIWPDWATEVVLTFNHGVIFYFLALNSVYLFLFLLSLGEVRNFVRRTFFTDYQQMMESEMTWPISVLMAAHNEQDNIVESVRSLMMVNYSEFEIIVVNDGSTDETLERLVAAFDLRRVDRAIRESLPSAEVREVFSSLIYPNLIVLDKEKGGKSDALNAGINISRYPLVCSIDADSVIEDNALLRVVRPFMEQPQETIAVGGIVRVVNGCRVEDGRVTRIELPDRGLPVLQAVEYLRAFLAGRVGWSALRSLLIISGTFGVYKKQVLIEIGGFSTETDTEDLELIVRMHRHMRKIKRRYRMVFVPDPVCWTEVPTDVATLRRQRTRWHRGLVQTLWRNRGMCLNPRYGSIGMFAFPYFFLFEMLGPFIEIAGYIMVILSLMLGLLDAQFFLLFLAVSVLYGIFLSISAILLEEISFRRYPRWLDLAKLVAYSVVENFGYRQMLSLFKISGVWHLARGRRVWGEMPRSGFKTDRRARQATVSQ